MKTVNVVKIVLAFLVVIFGGWLIYGALFSNPFYDDELMTTWDLVDIEEMERDYRERQQIRADILDSASTTLNRLCEEKGYEGAMIHPIFAQITETEITASCIKTAQVTIPRPPNNK